MEEEGEEQHTEEEEGPGSSVKGLGRRRRGRGDKLGLGRRRKGSSILGLRWRRGRSKMVTWAGVRGGRGILRRGGGGGVDIYRYIDRYIYIYRYIKIYTVCTYCESCR